MKNTVEMGKNLTGVGISPLDGELLIEAAARTIPSMEGDETSIAEVRSEYLAEGTDIGSMPPPVSLKGAAKAVVGAVKGNNFTVFLDKLGERLAFERTGYRLYGALLSKFDASPPLKWGPARDELERIQTEERAHFELVQRALLSLGADPTVLTPAADVAAVSSMGLLQVMGDPRMSFQQSLEAALIAELVDNDAWRILVELAQAIGQRELAGEFETALKEEEDHLAKLRAWVTATTIDATKPADSD